MTSNFKDLKVWQQAHQLSLDIYKVSTKFPTEEKYGLTSQLRRAVVSIELNISEGCGKSTDKDFIRFMYNSLGSCQEVENIFILLKDLNMINEDEYTKLVDKVDHISKMLSNLIRSRKER